MRVRNSIQDPGSSKIRPLSDYDYIPFRRVKKRTHLATSVSTVNIFMRIIVRNPCYNEKPKKKIKKNKGSPPIK